MKKISLRANTNSIVPIPLSLLQGNQGYYINSTERTANHHDVFIDSDIVEPQHYRELIAILFNANQGDSVNIFLNSNGGHLDTAIAIVEGLKTTEAATTAIIIGACHSAASIIAMYCHDVVVLDGAYTMVHTASFGAQGNTSNVRSHTEFTVRQVEKLLNDTYEGFLTKDELHKVKTGVELWFDSEEIRKRMVSRAKLVKAKLKKEKKTTGDDGE